MLFVAQFEDDPERLHVRKAEMANHLRYLDERREQVLVGGSLRRDPAQDPLGGLWIIEASDGQDAEKLCHDDPFWIQGLRTSVTILHYSKAFPDRKTPI